METQPRGELSVEQKTELIYYLTNLIESLNRSESASSFCRALVHGVFRKERAVAAHLLRLSNESRLELIGAYGYPADELASFNISVWSESSAAESIRSGRSHVLETMREFAAGQTTFLLEIPIVQFEDPIGCLGIAYEREGQEFFQNLSFHKMLGLIGNACLNRFNSVAHEGAEILNSASKHDPSQVHRVLSSRQKFVLQGIVDEKTNLQIAHQLHLSESAIKQETVKIFRILGVKNRAEARQIALEIGLVD